MADDEDYQFFRNKRPDRVYLSRSIDQKEFRRGEGGQVEEIVRPFRIVSKIVETSESHKFIKDGKQISLRITDGERQEIKAKFYEDSRDIFALQLQKYTVKSGMPHHTYFTFVGQEILTLYHFLRNIELLPINGSGNVKLDDKFVESIDFTREQAIRLLSEQPGLVEEVIRSNATAQDVAILGHRRDQLGEFKRLLEDELHFADVRAALGNNKRNEDVWQSFFERNTWIFGYGLNYFLNSTLDGQRLEQVVKGYDFAGAGKRVDALLKTHGLVSALSFGEIKTHKAPLLKKIKEPYRRECWQVSDELAGGIAQIQRTVQVSLSNLRSKTEIKGDDGALTGEQLFLYQPKAFLIIGSLAEFQGEHGINEERYSSFEIFRRNTVNPEIITFDELYERAKYIVDSGGHGQQ